MRVDTKDGAVLITLIDPEPCLIDAELGKVQGLLRLFALCDLPGEIGEKGDSLDILDGIVMGLVTHPDNRDDTVAAKNRQDQFPDDFCMVRGHPLAMGKGGVVIVDHRLSLLDAVYPDACLRDVIV